MKNFAPLNISSPAVGFPARLCTITRTDGVVFRIAESDKPITIGAETWHPVAGCNISAVTHTSNGEVPSCQVMAIHQNGGYFNTADLDAGLFDSAAIQIYIVDRANLSRKGLLFTGKLANITYGATNFLAFDAKGGSVGAKILMTQKRSPMCRTDLFSVLCGVPASSYDVAATVVSMIDVFNFTVSGPTNPDGWFNQGIGVTSSGETIEIANWVQSTATLTAYLPANLKIEPGATLTLYPGCDKTLETGCRKYNNQLNFQGEPHFLGTAGSAQTVA